MKKDDILIKVGDEVRRLRKQRKITREQLSEITGIGRTAISKYENGSIEMPMSSFVTICDALQIDFIDVLEGIK